MNKMLLTAACLSATLLSCSGGNAKTQDTKMMVLPVSWHSGYKMPALLEQTINLTTLSDVGSLLDKKWYAEFTVKHSDSPEKTYTLSSCRSIAKTGKDSKKLSTIPARNNAPFMEITAMCKATETIAKGIAANQTFLQDLKFDTELPNKLPARVAMIISVTESDRLLSDTNIKYWSQINKITKVTIHSPYHATYTHDDGSQQEIELLARGDFNGDGIEDIMLTSRDSVDGGSYSATRLFLLTRLAFGARVKILSS